MSLGVFYPGTSVLALELWGKEPTSRVFRVDRRVWGYSEATLLTDHQCVPRSALEIPVQRCMHGENDPALALLP
jgi:hypothetical protein